MDTNSFFLSVVNTFISASEFYAASDLGSRFALFCFRFFFILHGYIIESGILHENRFLKNIG